MITNEIKNKTDEIKKWEEIIKRKNLKYETNKNRFDFQQFKTIRFFGDNIYNGKINIKETKMKQAILLENIQILEINLDQDQIKIKKKKQNTLDNINALYEDRELILNAFGSGIFPRKEKQGKGLNLLTPKQMLQRLPIALAQEKACNASENLSNEIRQIIYSLS